MFIPKMLDRSIPPTIYPIQDFTLKKPITQVLPNGISVHFINAGVQPIVSVQLIFPTGSWLTNTPELNHFTAKMLVEGTVRKNATQITNEIDKYGAFLEVGAGLDDSSIDFNCLNKYLPQLLGIVEELLYEATFPEQELEKLKKIAIQNIKINNEKTGFVASSEFKNNLFGKTNPYGHITTIEDVLQVNPAQLIAHYHQYFSKQPFRVIVAGAFAEEEMLLISNFFGKLEIKKQNHTHQVAYLTQTNYTPIYIEKENAVQTSIRIGKEVLKRGHEDFTTQLVLNTILGGFFGSRLMSNIREEKGLSYGISSQISILRNATYMMIGTDVKKDQRQVALDEIYKEINLLMQQPVPQEELDLVKNYMKGVFVSSLNTPFALADKFKTIYAFGLSEDYYDRHIQRIEDITSAQILDLANRLYQDQFTEVLVG